MKNHPRPSACLLGSAVLLAAPSAPANAQDSEAIAADEIVVSASRAGQSINQLGDAISIISAEDIELQQLQTLDDALERAPGVTITRSGGVGQNTQVRMRGFTSKHVLVLIDGVKLNNPSEADNQFGIDHLLLDNIDRIEVLRGPQSGIYGADAVAGVINIVTKRPEGPLEARGSAMYGSNETYELNAGLQAGGERFGFSSSISYFDTEGISLSSRPPGNVERDGYDNLTMQFRGEFRPTDDIDLSGWVRYTDARNEIDANFLPADNPGGLPGFLFQDSEGFNENEQLFAALKGVWRTFGGALEHTAQFSYVDLDGRFVAPGQEQESDGRTIEGVYFATARPVDRVILIAGAEYRDESAVFEQPEGFAFALIDDSIHNAAGFAEANVEIVDGLFVSGAARYDDNEKFGGEFTFRATGAYNLPEAFDIAGVDSKLRVSYGEGAEAPGLRQLLGSSATFRGNPDLQPESNWMVDFGIDQQLENGLAAWSLTYYIGEATDGIFNVFDLQTGISTPQNVDSPVEMRGLEVDFTVSPAPWIELRGAYTHMTAALESSDRQLFGRPKNEGSAALTLRPFPGLALTADGYWRDEFFSDFPSTFEMPGYSVYNLSAVYDVSDRLRLAVSLQNIADKFYEEKLGDSTYGRVAQVRLTARY